MAGTAWIDEEDKVIQHVEGRFINNFKIGGGLVASIGEGHDVPMHSGEDQRRGWLPQSIAAQGHARVLLLYAIDGQMRRADERIIASSRRSRRLLPGTRRSYLSRRPERGAADGRSRGHGTWTKRERDSREPSLSQNLLCRAFQWERDALTKPGD